MREPSFEQRCAIGRKLAALRQDRRLEQTELAERIGCSSRAISWWETGARLPSTVAVWALCQFYDVTFEELVGDVLDQAPAERRTA